MDCQNCPLKERVEYMHDQIKELEKKYSTSRKSIYERLENLERQSALTDERYKRILEELEELKNTIKPLTEKPQKRWDTAVTSTITAIVGGIVGFIISKIFGG